MIWSNGICCMYFMNTCLTTMYCQLVTRHCCCGYCCCSLVVCYCTTTLCNRKFFLLLFVTVLAALGCHWHCYIILSLISWNCCCFCYIILFNVFVVDIIIVVVIVIFLVLVGVVSFVLILLLLLLLLFLLFICCHISLNITLVSACRRSIWRACSAASADNYTPSSE